MATRLALLVMLVTTMLIVRLGVCTAQTSRPLGGVKTLSIREPGGVSCANASMP